MSQSTICPEVSVLWNKYSYNPLKGIFYSRITNKEIVGFVNQRGNYTRKICMVKHKSTKYTSSYGRVVYAWLTGSWPSSSLHIDHIDRNQLNNTAWNLKLVTPRQNNYNKNNFTGCSWDKITKSWKVRIKVDGKEYWLGRYKTKEEAQNVYWEAVKYYKVDAVCIHD